MKSKSFEPFEGFCVAVTADADPGGGPLRKPSRFGVNWPSLGTTGTAKSRKFAQAILDACDWVDDQRNLHVAEEIREGRCPFGMLSDGQTMGHCPHGFPGCGCMDEMINNPYFGGASDDEETAQG